MANIVLLFLWTAFAVLSVVAFYAVGANGTDRYPPFTLAPLAVRGRGT